MKSCVRALAALSIALFATACDDASDAGGGGAGGGTADGSVDRDATAAACTDGEQRCADDTVEVCAAGRWATLAICGDGTECRDGGCQPVACEPDCDGRACGDDGCGGSCGDCEGNPELCDDAGQCGEPPVDPECGDATCDEGEDCQSCPDDCGACCGDGACTPEHGEGCDTCADDCGCGEGEVCEEDVCVEAPCEPACDGAVCGDDGCGGACGDCGEGELCDQGACVQAPPQCGDAVCEEGESCLTCPADCGGCCGDGACTAEHGEDCATCLADCSCGDGERCDAEQRVCVVACVPACDGRACGGDGCDGSCGDCPGDRLCDNDGQCVDPPEQCGDGACGEGEDCATCPADCGQCCGNGACSGDENCANCPLDCECGPEERCDVGARECVEACAPDCSGGRVCGPDGCGGQCGECAAGSICDIEAGRCGLQCEPQCVGRQCGPDNCGGECGVGCGPDDVCNGQGQCVPDCVPACDGRQCGGDGCGGDCGVCGGDERCDDGQCVPLCVPACDGRVCGGDGCGGQCGVCEMGQLCSARGQCVGGGLGCDCADEEVCLDGVCRAPEQLCSRENADGLCANGQDCVAGACIDNGAGCSNQNPTGVCAAGEICLNGACEPFEGAALCDDRNPCTLDFFDAVRNRCDHADVDAECSDGNGCTVNRCEAGQCVADPIDGCVAPPVVDPYDSPTNVGDLQLTGRKPAGSSIEIDGQQAVPESPEEDWDVTLNLVPGENVYRVRSVDQGEQSAEVEVRVVYDIEPPVTRISPEGGVFLDGLTVTVATNEPATVYYTTDGGTPDAFSESFISARTFRVFDDTTLRFRARDIAGNWEEEIRVADFEITGHGNGWYDGAALPEALTHVGAAYNGGNTLYVAGGSDGLAAQAGFFAYHYVDEAWENLPAMPAARSQLSVAFSGDHLYAFGGEDDGIPLNAVTRIRPGVDEAWEQRRAMPTTRFGLAAVEQAGRVYVFGGKTNGGVVLSTLQVYNPANDTWDNQVEQMPRPRYAFAAVPYDFEIYLVGGEDENGVPIGEVDVYDYRNDQWRQAADLPTPRSFLSAGRNDNRGGLTGGYDGLVVAGGRLLGGAATAVVEEYIFQTGEWRTRRPMRRPRHSAVGLGVQNTGVADSAYGAADSLVQEFWVIGGQVGDPGGQVGDQLTDSLVYFHQNMDYIRHLEPLPEGRFMHAAVPMNERVYLFGGRNFQETVGAWVFDPETETYADIADLPSPQNGLAAVAFMGRIWAIGGANAFGNAVPTLRSYDPATDEWTDHRPMLSARRDAAAVVMGGRIWVVGGANNGAVQAVEAYDPFTDRWSDEALLPEARSGAVAVQRDGTLFVGGGRNADGALRSNIYAFDGDGWVDIGADRIPVADAAGCMIGDDRWNVFAGRGNALSDEYVSVDLSNNQVGLGLEAGDYKLAPYDFQAIACVNGEVYLFGGNATVEVGPEGQALVQKLSGRCMNGVRDGFEEEPDSRGGCGVRVPPPFLPPAVGTRGRVGVIRGADWHVCRADQNTAWISTHSGGGNYNATTVCRHLGYDRVDAQGGTCGMLCGRCGRRVEEYDGGGGAVSNIGSTVHWRCRRNPN